MRKSKIPFTLLACAALTSGGYDGIHTSPKLGLSVGESDFSGIYINWFKGCGSPIYNESATPQMLDANGYPNSAVIPSGSSIFCRPEGVPNNYGGSWEWFFSGTGQVQLQFASISVISNPAPSPIISNAQACTVSGNALSGTNCDIVINISGSPPNLSHLFTAGTFTNFGNEGLIRSSDKSAYLSGQVFTPEWISLLKQARPLFLRTMGMSFPNQSAENETSWAVRTPTAAFSYNLPYYPPSIWAGTDTTHTDNYVFSSYSSMPGQWTESEVFQARFTNASRAAITISGAASHRGLVQLTVNSTSGLTTGQSVLIINAVSQSVGQNVQAPHVYTVTVIDATHIDLQGTTYSRAWTGSGTVTTTTINVGGRGAKFAVAENVLGAAGIAVNSINTCHYDALLDLLLCSQGGINAGMPPEIQVEQSNEAGAPLWANIPPFWQPSDVASWTSYINANLKSGLDFYVEFNNENWNYIFQAQNWTQRGYALGWQLSNNQALYSYIGLRHRQLMPFVLSGWTRPRSQLHLVGGAQAFGSASLFGTYEFSGSSLCGTSCGNSAYQKAVGVDYNSAPNRPQDFMDYYSIATYFSGAQENGNTGTLAELSGIIKAATQYAAGNKVDAFTFVDNDNRTGACGGCGNELLTISNLQNSIYPRWNILAARDGKNLIAYEGGFSSWGPAASYLAKQGDSNASTDATNINNLLIAYRSSPQFYSTYYYHNSVWFGFSQVVGNAQLSVQGGSPINVNSQAWQALSGGIYPAQPYQSWLAIHAINNNWINNNSP